MRAWEPPNCLPPLSKAQKQKLDATSHEQPTPANLPEIEQPSLLSGPPTPSRKISNIVDKLHMQQGSNRDPIIGLEKVRENKRHGKYLRPIFECENLKMDKKVILLAKGIEIIAIFDISHVKI